MLEDGHDHLELVLGHRAIAGLVVGDQLLYRLFAQLLLCLALAACTSQRSCLGVANRGGERLLCLCIACLEPILVIFVHVVARPFDAILDCVGPADVGDRIRVDAWRVQLRKLGIGERAVRIGNRNAVGRFRRLGC